MGIIVPLTPPHEHYGAQLLMPQTPESLLRPALDIARAAGDEILKIYETDFDVESKDDDSPLTAADMASHRTIVAGLEALTPDLPILSEESGEIPFETRAQWPRYWLVDPLDGTKEFIKRNGQFTVNIALIDGHRPVLGVVHVPVTQESYFGCAGAGAFLKKGGAEEAPIQTASLSSGPVRVVGSRSHRGQSLDNYLERLGDHELVPMGSSLKFCVVARGDADVYPRLGLTSEWDTAAAQAVLEAAGGGVVTLEGEPLDYNAKADILNPFFIAFADGSRDWTQYL